VVVATLTRLVAVKQLLLHEQLGRRHVLWPEPRDQAELTAQRWFPEQPAAPPALCRAQPNAELSHRVRDAPRPMAETPVAGATSDSVVAPPSLPSVRGQSDSRHVTVCHAGLLLRSASIRPEYRRTRQLVTPPSHVSEAQLVVR